MWHGFAPGFVNYKKVHSTRSASDQDENDYRVLLLNKVIA